MQIPTFDIPFSGLDFLPDFFPLLVFFLIIIISVASALAFNWKKAVFISSWLFISYALTLILTSTVAPNILPGVVKPLLSNFLSGGAFDVEFTDKQINDLYFLFIPVFYFVIFLLIILILSPFFIILLAVFHGWINKEHRKAYVKIENGQVKRVVQVKKSIGGVTRLVSCGLVLASSIPLASAGFDFTSLISKKSDNSKINQFSNSLTKFHDFLNWKVENGDEARTLLDGLMKSFSKKYENKYSVITGKDNFGNEGEKYKIQEKTYSPINAFVNIFIDLFSNLAIPGSFENPMQAIEQLWWGVSEEKPIGVSDAIHATQMIIGQMNQHQYNSLTDNIDEEIDTSLNNHIEPIDEIFQSPKLLDLFSDLVSQLDISLGDISPNFIIAYIYFVLIATGKLLSTKNNTIHDDLSDTDISQWETIKNEYKEAILFSTPPGTELIGQMDITLYDLLCIFNPLTDYSSFTSAGDLSSLTSNINMQTLLEKKIYGSFVPRAGSYIYQMEVLNENNRLYLFDNQKIFKLSDGTSIKVFPLIKFETQEIPLDIGEIDINGSKITAPSKIQLNLKIGSKSNEEPLIDFSNMSLSKNNSKKTSNYGGTPAPEVTTINLTIPMIFLNNDDEKKAVEKANEMNISVVDNPVYALIGAFDQQLSLGGNYNSSGNYISEHNLKIKLPTDSGIGQFVYRADEWDVKCSGDNLQDYGLLFNANLNGGGVSSVTDTIKIPFTVDKPTEGSTPLKPNKICTSGTFVIQVKYTPKETNKEYVSDYVGIINIIPTSMIAPMTISEDKGVTQPPGVFTETTGMGLPQIIISPQPTFSGTLPGTLGEGNAYTDKVFWWNDPSITGGGNSIKVFDGEQVTISGISPPAADVTVDVVSKDPIIAPMLLDLAIISGSSANTNDPIPNFTASIFPSNTWLKTGALEGSDTKSNISIVDNYSSIDSIKGGMYFINFKYAPKVETSNKNPEYYPIHADFPGLYFSLPKLEITNIDFANQIQQAFMEQKFDLYMPQILQKTINADTSAVTYENIPDKFIRLAKGVKLQDDLYHVHVYKFENITLNDLTAEGAFFKLIFDPKDFTCSSWATRTDITANLYDNNETPDAAIQSDSLETDISPMCDEFKDTSFPDGVCIKKSDDDKCFYLSGTPKDSEWGLYRIIPNISLINEEYVDTCGIVFPFFVTDTNIVDINATNTSEKIDKMFSYNDVVSSEKGETKEVKLDFKVGDVKIEDEDTNLNVTVNVDTTELGGKPMANTGINDGFTIDKITSGDNQGIYLKFDPSKFDQGVTTKGNFVINVSWKNPENGVVYSGSFVQEFIVYGTKKEYEQYQKYDGCKFFTNDKCFIKLHQKGKPNNLGEMIGDAFAKLFHTDDVDKNKLYKNLCDILLENLVFKFE